MPETKLKPCPFCGGHAALDNELVNAAYVKCLSCGAETTAFKVSASYCANDKAVEAWNKRAEKESALPVEYEADGYDDNGNLIYDTAYCPVCHNDYEVDYDDHDNYCRNCGQKLDWRSNNEM